MTDLSKYPPFEQWHDWTELDAKAWPEKVERNYTLVPTTCFNCEAGCGLVAYFDQDTGEIAKIEGNPEHPASRGRNCAKGPATLNQVYDPERVMYPMKRVGERGSGQWERITWDQALDEVGARIRTAIRRGPPQRGDVPRRPSRRGRLHRSGAEGLGCRRPQQPHQHLLVERPHRLPGVDGPRPTVVGLRQRRGHLPDLGAPRGRVTTSTPTPSASWRPRRRAPRSSRSTHGCPTPAPRPTTGCRRGPGTEPFLLLAIARLLIESETWNAPFVQRWTNWETYLREKHPDLPGRVGVRSARRCSTSTPSTPPRPPSRRPASTPRRFARSPSSSATIPTKFASHNWRAAGAGNLGGWQVARCLFFLNVLTGSVATKGGTAGNGMNKFKPAAPDRSAGHHELERARVAPRVPARLPRDVDPAAALPQRGARQRSTSTSRGSTTRSGPTPTGSPGWRRSRDEEKVQCHVALTPTWSETSWFADYVLPMGVSTERHDVHSYETHAGRWIGFRQSVFRRYAELEQERATGSTDLGPDARSYDYNPGEVWEENEFWIDLSWRIDPDGRLGVREWFESDRAPRQADHRRRVLRRRCSGRTCRDWPRQRPRPDRPRSST